MASEASPNPAIDNTTNPNATKLPSEQGLVFNRSDFLQGAATRREVSSQGKETGVVTSENVVLTAETTDSYKSFMTDHFAQLLKQNEYGTMIPNPSGGEMPFKDYIEQYHPHEANILKFITSEDGTKVDQAKLDNFLKTSKGMMIATQLLEDVTAQKLFMLGLAGVKNNEGGRLDVADEMHIKLGIDQGRLNRLADNMQIQRDALMKTVGGTAGIAGLAAGGAYLANQYFNGEPVYGVDPTIAGAAAGAATGIGLGAINALKNSLARGVSSFKNEGVTIDLKRNLDGIRIIQSNPQEAAYLKAITGVDINDFEITSDYIQVKDASQRVAESTRDPNEVTDEVLQGLYARSKFLEDLGINPSKINGTAEQRFMRGKKGSAPSLESEKTGGVWERMIQDEFKPNEGGIRDKFGRKPGDAFYGTGNDAKLFIKDTVGGAITFRDPLPAEQDEYKKNPNDPKFHIQNRRVFFVDNTSGTRILKEWDPKVGPPLETQGVEFRFELGSQDQIRATINPADLTNPASYIVFTQDIPKGNEFLYQQFNSDNLDTEGNLKRYSEARRRVISKMTEKFILEDQERAAKKTEQAQEQKFSKQIAKASEVIDTKINNLKNEDTKREREAELNEEETKLNARNTELDEKLKAFEGSDNNIQHSKKQQDLAIELKISLGIDINKASDIQDEINRITTELQKTGGLAEQFATVSKQVSDRAEEMWTKALDEIKALPINLQQRATLPDYNQLLTRAQEQTPEYTKVQGQLTPELDKIQKLKEAHSLYQNADIEIAKSNTEKAGNASINIPGLKATFDKVSDSTNTNSITESELLTLSTQDLIQRALDLENPPGTKLYADRNEALQAVVLAKTEAQMREEFLQANPTLRGTSFSLRDTPENNIKRYRASLQIEKQYIKDRLANITQEKGKIGSDIKQEIARLEAYKAALPNIQNVSERQGDIFSEVREELTQNIEQYTNQTKVDNTNTRYTPAEQTANQPEGYYELLDLLFKYKTSPDREKIFSHVSQILPADKLSEKLQKYLVLPAPGVGRGPRTKDLTHILTYIRNNKDSFDKRDYRQAFMGIINDLREEALAFTKI